MIDPTRIDAVASDPTLGVLADVPVTLEFNGKVMASTTTDANGRFTFTGLSSGRYKVWANYGGARILVLDAIVKQPPGGGTAGVYLVRKGSGRIRP